MLAQFGQVALSGTGMGCGGAGGALCADPRIRNGDKAPIESVEQPCDGALVVLVVLKLSLSASCLQERAAGQAVADPVTTLGDSGVNLGEFTDQQAPKVGGLFSVGHPGDPRRIGCGQVRQLHHVSG